MGFKFYNFHKDESSRKYFGRYRNSPVLKSLKEHNPHAYNNFKRLSKECYKKNGLGKRGINLSRGLGKILISPFASSQK